MWRATVELMRKTEVKDEISIHALRVEGDKRAEAQGSAKADISIHALRVEGDHFGLGRLCVLVISIHALRVEGD